MVTATAAQAAPTGASRYSDYRHIHAYSSLCGTCRRGRSRRLREARPSWKSPRHKRVPVRPVEAPEVGPAERSDRTRRSAPNMHMRAPTRRSSPSSARGRWFGAANSCRRRTDDHHGPVCWPPSRVRRQHGFRASDHAISVGNRPVTGLKGGRWHSPPYRRGLRTLCERERDPHGEGTEEGHHPMV